MEWVRMGKTNIEVAMILDISSFTVKNHLQRIFKKLGVFNRMQAVARFEQGMLLSKTKSVKLLLSAAVCFFIFF